MNFKVQIILILVFYEKVSSNDFARLSQLPKVPLNLSLYRYEGNFYPIYSPKKINLNDVGLLQEDGKTKPIRFTRYLNPVHLSHQIYHYPNPYGNHEALSNINNINDDATGSGYQMAMKVQPLQQVISSGKQPQDIEESGKSHQAKRQLKIDIMSPKKMQSLRNSQNGFYNHDKNNELLRMKIVPNKMDTVSRQYHDIFVKYKSPQELVFGHVLSWPELAQKRLEKRDKNNFRGQVIWADKTGGYGEHYWDLAQGAL